MFDINKLKNKIAVIGLGNSYGNFLHIEDYGLAAQAFSNIVADCGIDKNKIDGASRLPHPVLRVSTLRIFRAEAAVQWQDATAGQE